MVYSPLRYPGGKRTLTAYIASKLDGRRVFIEPFCGGASVSLELLFTNKVDKIILNDFDTGIYSFWYAVLYDTKRLIDTIRAVPVTPEEWKRQKEILKKEVPVGEYDFDKGFATFYLNRTNRSGIIKGGMIGGVEQSGKYKIDARFNKEPLIARIEKIATMSSKIELYNMDAIELFKEHHWQNAFVYLDPPYFQKGSQVYTTYFTKEDHKNLRDGIAGSIDPKYRWLLSYDDCREIHDLYAGYATSETCFHYSITKPVKAKELIIEKDTE